MNDLIKPEDNILMEFKVSYEDDMIKKFLDTAEQQVQEYIQTADINGAIQYVSNINSMRKAGGIALAKTLYLIEKNWKRFGVDDDFIHVMAAQTGINKVTITRYSLVWKMFAEGNIPEESKARLLTHNIRDLIPIAKKVEDGAEVDEKAWERLSYASNAKETQVALNDVLDVTPNSNTLFIFIDEEGSLYAKTRDEGEFFIGKLILDSETLTAQRAIGRILARSEIIKRISE